MVMAVFSLKLNFCRLRGQMQTLEWLKNDFHFAEICNEAINHVEFVLTAEQYKDTKEVLLTDTRRQTAILMAAFTKPHFNSHTNSSFFTFPQGDNSRRQLRTLQGLRVRF